jgi:hypothetical protein
MINTYVRISIYHYCYYYALQASAHFLQASAHALQQASSCLLHSATQALQHFTHKAHNSSANFESLAHNLAQSAQISAQSRHTLMQSSRPDIVQHIEQHFSHSIMQAKQASIQIFEFFILKKLFVKPFSQCKDKCSTSIKSYKIKGVICIIHTKSNAQLVIYHDSKFEKYKKYFF